MPVTFSDDPIKMLPGLLKREAVLEDELRLVRQDIDACRFHLEMSGRIKRFGDITVLLATEEEIEESRLEEFRKYGVE